MTSILCVFNVSKVDALILNKDYNFTLPFKSLGFDFEVRFFSLKEIDTCNIHI